MQLQNSQLIPLLPTLAPQHDAQAMVTGQVIIGDGGIGCQVAARAEQGVLDVGVSVGGAASTATFLYVDSVHPDEQQLPWPSEVRRMARAQDRVVVTRAPGMAAYINRALH